MSQVRLTKWLTTDTLVLSGLTLKAGRRSKNAIGGPHRAEISADGEELAMWNGISALGAGVEILTAENDKAWWGYIHEAVLVIGAVTIHATLDNIKNKIRVLYTTIDETTGAKSGPVLTDWEYDPDATARYGVREYVHSVDGISETEAVYLRHTLLEAMKDPLPSISLSGGTGQPPSLTFHCRGYYETLDNRYFKRTFNECGYKDAGVGMQRFGQSTTFQKVGMSFEVDSTDDYAYLDIPLLKYNGPTDGLVAKLYDDSGGDPNSLLGTSVEVDAADISAVAFTWTRFTFSTAVSLTASTTYWIVLERSGSLSDSNYYRVDTNTPGTYADGAMKYYNGASWAATDPVKDMLFWITTAVLATEIDSTALIEIIVEEYGSSVEVNTVEVINTSGINVSPVRDGSNTALAEIGELLEKGSTNYRRMLARVLSNKRLEVYEEPAATASGWIDRNGKIYDKNGAPMRAETCPVAMWVSLKGVVPVGASFGKISPDTCFFIESSEYDETNQTLAITPREIAGRDQFWIVGNG